MLMRKYSWSRSKHAMSGAMIATIAASVATADARADAIFDTSFNNPNTAASSRHVSSSNFAATLQFSQNTTVSQIGLFSKVDQAQSIEFLIFSSNIYGGGGTLLFSDVIQAPFLQNTNPSFLYSDIINYTFLAGQTYDIGILGSGTGTTYLTGYYYSGNYTQNGITELQNGNISNFTSPTDSTNRGTQAVDIQLLQIAVPEPASLTVFGSALVALAGMARRRKRRT